MVRERVRIRFRKAGDLRWTSHHDLMRCFERMLRRAALPFHSTQGFNPHPRLVFAQPLPLGLIGGGETVDLELDESLTAAEVRDRLAAVAPPGLEILGVEPVDLRAAVQPHAALYRLPLPAGRADSLTERAAELLAATECWVERTRPQPRRLDVRPYLDALRVTPEYLELHLRITPNGSARPEEVLRLLGLDDLLEAGAVLERVRLELNDGLSAAGAPAQPRPLEDSRTREQRAHEEGNAD